MCSRVHILIAAAACTYLGKEVRAISYDSRIQPSVSTINDPTHPWNGATIANFPNSDKEGIIIKTPSENITAAEFTDTVPEHTLILEYVEPQPEAPPAE